MTVTFSIKINWTNEKEWEWASELERERKFRERNRYFNLIQWKHSHIQTHTRTPTATERQRESFSRLYFRAAYVLSWLLDYLPVRLLIRSLSHSRKFYETQWKILFIICKQLRSLASSTSSCSFYSLFLLFKFIHTRTYKHIASSGVFSIFLLLFTLLFIKQKFCLSFA